jgi:hypothetical protein
MKEPQVAAAAKQASRMRILKSANELSRQNELRADHGDEPMSHLR